MFIKGVMSSNLYKKKLQAFGTMLDMIQRRKSMTKERNKERKQRKLQRKGQNINISNKASE